jgi:hypothetical protein
MIRILYIWRSGVLSFGNIVRGLAHRLRVLAQRASPCAVGVRCWSNRSVH